MELSPINIEDIQAEKRSFYELREMRTEDRELVRLALLGYKTKDISRILKKSLVHVREVIKSPAVARQLAVLNEARDAAAVDVAQQIKDLAPRALEVVAEVLEEDKAVDTKLQVDAAFRILAATGNGPVQKVNVNALHAVADVDLIREINQSMQEQSDASRTG